MLPVLTCAWKVSATASVVASASGCTEKEPVFEVIVKLPLEVVKSPAFVTVQYKVVASSTFVVVTFINNVVPSSTSVALFCGTTEYVGSAVRLVSLIVIDDDVTTIVPPTLSVLICASNVSAPSVVVSAVGNTLNDPAFAVIVKLPDEVAKSPALVKV